MIKNVEYPLRITIPVAPVTKKNSQEIAVNQYTGKRFVRPSKAYEKYASMALWYLPRLASPIDFPVNVRCTFYRKDAHMCDLTNLEECIDDILVVGGVLKDDNYGIIASHDGSRVFIDRKNPRTEVVITPAETHEKTIDAMRRRNLYKKKRNIRPLQARTARKNAS